MKSEAARFGYCRHEKCWQKVKGGCLRGSNPPPRKGTATKVPRVVFHPLAVEPVADMKGTACRKADSKGFPCLPIFLDDAFFT